MNIAMQIENNNNEKKNLSITFVIKAVQDSFTLFYCIYAYLTNVFRRKTLECYCC